MSANDLKVQEKEPVETEEVPEEDLVTKDRHQSINPAGESAESEDEEAADDDLRVMDRHQSSSPAD
ncbi:hypothetical protein HCC61_16545 [Streptomyces sp. HNM0575]|uniref:hypothetical protein n=1 Tax=Streptomyces sp. HNM0575 TaxID=2716338 RepID=UPI00145CAF61|nr:hypothetical protein [Streptomyces sp. HNM0575]NLU74270.1 hypothetical protein [Streptomyces sp. HNM0575]